MKNENTRVLEDREKVNFINQNCNIKIYIDGKRNA